MENVPHFSKTRDVAVSERPHLKPYARSPFQVAFLMFATFGLYFFYWAYMTRKRCAALLGLNENIAWKTVGILVPLLNLVVLFELGERIRTLAWRASGIDDDAPPIPGSRSTLVPWLPMLYIGIGALWRLPDPYTFISGFDFLPIAVAHVTFARAQIAFLGIDALPTKLTWGEWVMVTIGLLAYALALIGLPLPDVEGGPINNFYLVFGIGVLVIQMTLLGAVKRASDRAIREALTRCDDIAIAHSLAELSPTT